MKHNSIIIGSSGFVGKNLIQFFKKRGVDFKSISRDGLVSLQPTDFDSDSTIVHLAGKAHDLKNTSNPQSYYEANYELTKKLYDLFLDSNAAKFIFISSVKASADSVNGILTEDDKPIPLTDYGKSKLMAEQYIQNQILPPGKSYYILRPCMIHGPGNKGNLNLLYKVVKKGIPYPLASFHNLRSFLSIANFNFVIYKIIIDSIPSGVYNIADDEALATNQVIKIISNINEKRPKLWHVNKLIIKILAIIGDKMHLPLNSESLKKLTENYVVSNEKIKRVLNIKQLPVSAEEGLSATVKSFHSS